MNMGFGMYRDLSPEEVIVLPRGKSYLEWYLSTPDLMKKHPALTDEIKRLMSAPAGVTVPELPKLGVSGIELYLWLRQVAESGKLKRPAITINNVKFKWYMPKSVLPSDFDNEKNQVRITKADSKWPDVIEYAYITRDGVIHVRKLVAEVINLITELVTAVDMRAYIADAGMNSGNCCYCNHELTDPRSVTNGYGATCAKNWGLVW